MNSEGHRRNILECGTTLIGVGYATGGSYRHYWTQNFGKLY
ncbi:CAP domain-containing protein [Candidatus Frankia datiscae]